MKWHHRAGDYRTSASALCKHHPAPLRAAPRRSVPRWGSCDEGCIGGWRWIYWAGRLQ